MLFLILDSIVRKEVKMIKKLLIWVILILTNTPAFAEIVDTAWVRRYNGPGNYTDEALAITVDKSCNVYVTGYSSQTPSPQYNYDYATVKYYPSGDTAWARRYDASTLSDIAEDIAVDDSGNVYVTGYSYDYTTSYDIITIKYYSNGETSWVRRFNGPGNGWDMAYAIAVDSFKNVYVTGYCTGSGSSSDYVTIRYYSNGDTAWVRTYNGPENYVDQAKALNIDGQGNVYVTGKSYANWRECDMVTIKYNSNGDTVWIRRYSGLNDATDYGNALVTDDSGNVYVTGSGGEEESGYPPEYQDYVTIKYYPDGDTAWVRKIRWY